MKLARKYGVSKAPTKYKLFLPTNPSTDAPLIRWLLPAMIIIMWATVR